LERESVLTEMVSEKEGWAVDDGVQSVVVVAR
jgi:hypothetical protein